MKSHEFMFESLKFGRDIYPRPKNVKWRPIGKPQLVKIQDLDLNPYGLSIAQAQFTADSTFKHENTKPISVTLVDNVPHVLDGYHRIVQAFKNNNKEILAQFFV